MSTEHESKPLDRLFQRSNLRPVLAQDADGVMQLFERHGWPLRSRAGWNWALIESPARRAAQAEAGWVLESAGQIVGFLGNLPARFTHDGEEVWGATCTSLLVDEAHRALSMSLVRAFAAQPGVAFTYSATANENSAPLYRAFGFQPCSDARADQRLRWMVSSMALARAALDRVHLGWLLPVRLVQRVPPVAWSAATLRRLDLNLTGLHVDRVSAADLASERGRCCVEAWDAWANELARGPGLWPDRSARTFQWRMSDPDLAEGELGLWALRDSQGRMLGVCMARRLPHQSGQPLKAELMDLVVLPDVPRSALNLMLKCALRWAYQNGVAVLDAKRWTGATASQLEGLGARQQVLPPNAMWLREGVSTRNHGAKQTERLDWSQWAMTGCDSDDWFNSMRFARPAEGRMAAQPVTQPAKADVSSVIKSSSVSTDAGSNRSMSSV